MKKHHKHHKAKLQKRKTKKLTLNKILFLFSMLGIVLCIGYYLVFVMFTPYRISNNLVVINKGETLQHMLSDGGLSTVIHNKRLFYYLIRVLKIDKKIMPGIYALKTENSMWDIVMQLKDGKPTLISVTILSGWNFTQIKYKVDHLDNIVHATKNQSEEEIAKILNLPYNKIEGLLYPDTYYLSPSQTDLELYSHAYHKMQDKVKSILKSQNLEYLLEGNSYYTSEHYGNKLPYKDFYSVLTMASLIEKETSNPKDMQKVATVFVNRLNRGMDLQDDPAVFYGLNNKKTITRSDFKIDTPYNTYLHPGLPPSPICSPSYAAIIASVNPLTDKEVVYFVADGDGNTIFAKTYKEHKKNIVSTKV